MDSVLECFHEFMKDRLERYRIGKAFYPDGVRPGDQHCQNPYLKTEADVQMKFGAFLDEWLDDRDPSLTVHAEMPIFPHRARADLTIHRVSCDELWTSRPQIFGSLDSVIEIKYANIRQPLFDFNQGGIEKDFKLLKSLPPSVKRYFLLIDEAEAIDPAQDMIQIFLADAKLNRITIMSNNIGLMRVNG